MDTTHLLTLDTRLHTKGAHRRRMHQRKIANNTYLRRVNDNGKAYHDYALKLHNTDVATFHEDGSITLRTRGWWTVTTKDRINAALLMASSPLSVWTDKGTWYIGKHGSKQRFFDGMRIDPSDGRVLNPDDGPDFTAIDVQNDEMRKAIDKFVATLTPERYAKIAGPDLTFPERGGDCLLCRFGDAGDDEHLISHMEEDYHQTSLIYNALNEKGYAHPTLVMQMQASDADRGRKPRLITDALKSYLRKRLLKGVATR